VIEYVVYVDSNDVVCNVDYVDIVVVDVRYGVAVCKRNCVGVVHIIAGDVCGDVDAVITNVGSDYVDICAGVDVVVICCSVCVVVCWSLCPTTSSTTTTPVLSITHHTTTT